MGKVSCPASGWQGGLGQGSWVPPPALPTQDHLAEVIACSLLSWFPCHVALSGRHAEGICMLHVGEKPHKCELCDFTCRDVSYLSKHMLTHSNDKNFMCTECGYITKWKHYLNVHMRKHTGDLR